MQGRDTSQHIIYRALRRQVREELVLVHDNPAGLRAEPGMPAEVPRGDGESGVAEGLARARTAGDDELKVPLLVAEIELHQTVNTLDFPRYKRL